ncbi:SAE2-domain-containing protein [Coniochaeta ligniaria NRRL 30616]|uniref:SAE2-domain-containing protein n=1 Tax=Coniochaeta ligniaria NRRL 30616 TaxID=1408157 RepID=A0A1J7IQW5_9PEZI|nr:SAE2-domain-containing protein [Coniochaeta ligniaria NRRL 30616]
MASWFDRGRPAIFEALQQVCDRIDSDLAAELQERDVEQHAFLTKEVERLRSRIATVDKLEQENHALKGEVTALRSQLKSASDKLQTSAAAPPPTRQPLGEISTNTPSRVVRPRANPKEAINVDGDAAAKLAELQQDYKRLVTQCEQQRKAKGEAEAKARQSRKERIQWQKYAEGRDARIEKLEKRLGSSVQPQSSIEPRQPHPELESSRADATPADGMSASTSKATSGSSVPPQTSASASFSGLENAALTDVAPRRATSNPPAARRTVLTEHTASSTQGDDDDISEESPELPQLPPNDNTQISTVKNEPSSDLPVFVSEKRVGKRKHIDDIPDGLTSRTPRRFKTEERSSDPLVMGESHHFSPQESLDLDTDGTMPTPRKVRMLQMQDRSGVIRPDNDNIPGRSGIFEVRSALPMVGMRDVVHAPGTSVKDLHMNAAPTTQPNSMSLVPRRTAPGSGLKLHHGIASLAEDGYDPTRSERQAPTEDQLSDGPSRLAALLDASSPSPQGQTPLLRPNRQLREASRSSLWLTETPVRVLPFGKGDGKDGNPQTTLQSRAGGGLDSGPASVKATSRMETPKSAAPAIPRSKAKVRRLRDQPLASLRLDDFKINPKFNNGHGFAFTEVVRNKDERADIPGCVDPECCGKHFRAMAQSELEAAGPALIHRAADIALLEDYLGDQVYKLGSMTRQEKEELWLEAKTRELANKHGKHRHRFARRQSPPGFWNTDFPSTQDNEQDRAEGEKREKRMVEERYREAMRNGGRWLFRDE